MIIERDGIDNRTHRLPRVLWIELTSRCPFDCIFCTRKALRGAGEHMSFQMYERLIAELERPEILRLNYSGESGCYPRLADAIALAASTGAAVELVTALASLKGRRLRAVLDAGLTRLTVSLHTLNPISFAEIYRSGTLNDMHERLLEVVQWSAQRCRPFVLDLAFVAMHRNLDELSAVATFAQSVGIPVLAVHPLIGRDPLPLGEAPEHDGEGHLEEGFRNRLMNAVRRARDLAPAVDIYLSSHELAPSVALDGCARPWPWALPEGAHIADCDQSPFGTVHILADGSVVACEVTEKTALGTLRELSLGEIWHGHAYREFRRRHAAGQHPVCAGCIYKTAYLPDKAMPRLTGSCAPAMQLLRGWYPEEGGDVRWSGASAAFWLPTQIGQQHVRLQGIIAEQRPRQDSVFEIRIDGLPVYRESRPIPGPRDLLLPLADDDGDGHLLVEIDCTHAASPMQLQQSGDSRVLGFGLIRTEIVDTKEPFGVLIPERGRPDLLDGTLVALRTALENIDCPYEVHVLVNGSRPEHYRALCDKFPWVVWHFVLRPMGFHGAMKKLLKLARQPWVYLLNSDMRLHPDALRVLLPLRAPDVFTIASQIHFADPNRRREETGFTQPVVDAAGALQLHDIVPLDDTVRAHLYAGGGASLFQTSPLRRFFLRSNAYAPFYFEDADWSVQAWAAGLNVLFCPRSLAVHEHRATVSRYHSENEIASISTRNLRHFRWRYADCFGASRDGDAAGRTREQILRVCTPEHRRARAAVVGSSLCPDFHRLTWKRFPHAVRHRPGCPRVLLVSPFSVIPPAHGGARRILELARESAEHVDWILLHDEADHAVSASPSDDFPFREIHPTGGRPAHSDDPLERLRVHAHPRLAREMQRLIHQTCAQVVCLEHIESVYLVDAVPAGVPIILTLHDAGRNLAEPVAGLLRARLSRISTLVLSTKQDLGFWGHGDELVIENGVSIPHSVKPSPDCTQVLVVAPLRYDRNRSGLCRFLEEAWPRLREQIPSVGLTILGGDRANDYVSELPESPGVVIVDRFVDPAPYYAGCAVAINPQQDIEGSALKVAEALANGRVLVSTVSGARGYETLDSPAFCRVDDCSAMVPCLVDLLSDPSGRHERELHARVDIEPWSWRYRSDKLVERFRKLALP